MLALSPRAIVPAGSRNSLRYQYEGLEKFGLGSAHSRILVLCTPLELASYYIVVGNAEYRKIVYEYSKAWQDRVW